VSSEQVRTELDSGVAVITLDRPKALNALNGQLLLELEKALHALPKPPELRAVIITGAGEKAFVAGADIAEMAELNVDQARAFVEQGHRVLDLFESLTVPTIAAVNGFALGGGCELALACDLVYASENARFGLPEVGLGVIPGFGGTQRLARRVGRARAKELIFTGDMVDAARAKELGLALDVVPLASLLSHCKGVAAKIAKKSPVAIACAKDVIARGADLELSKGNQIEKDAFSVLFKSADQREGMKAFLEKRPPAFVGK
jgi:enoyl-CoA hydratase